jgi:hypothetical protein
MPYYTVDSRASTSLHNGRVIPLMHRPWAAQPYPVQYLPTITNATAVALFFTEPVLPFFLSRTTCLIYNTILVTFAWSLWYNNNLQVDKHSISVVCAEQKMSSNLVFSKPPRMCFLPLSLLLDLPVPARLPSCCSFLSVLTYLLRFGPIACHLLATFLLRLVGTKEVQLRNVDRSLEQRNFSLCYPHSCPRTVAGSFSLQVLRICVQLLMKRRNMILIPHRETCVTFNFTLLAALCYSTKAGVVRNQHGLCKL